MAGFPLRRLRKQGIRLADGSVVAFPYMPRVADLPPGWQRFSTADKIKHLLHTRLDQAYEILSWPVADLDLRRCYLQLQVMRVVMKIAGTAHHDGSLDREIAHELGREKALARMVSELPSLAAPRRPSPVRGNPGPGGEGCLKMRPASETARNFRNTGGHEGASRQHG
jgi:hypothetical protein